MQIGTTFAEEGVSCFARLEKEFADLMNKKGYNSVEKIKGKLRKID